MSGSLILIDSETASSSSSISLTGMDSTYDVYVATISGAKHSANAYDYFRLTANGTPVTSANYRAGGQVLRTAGVYYDMSQINATFVYLSPYKKVLRQATKQMPYFIFLEVRLVIKELMQHLRKLLKVQVY